MEGMRLRTDELTIALHGVDTGELLHSWRWLVPANYTPVELTKFGDWFFTDNFGRVHYLDLLDSTLTQIAPCMAEYERLKELDEMRAKWFLDGFVFRCVDEG